MRSEVMSEGIKTRKKAMLEALKKSLGIVSTAVKKVGITRQTHYNWLNSDEEYKAEVESIAEEEIDFVESHLRHLIQDGNPAATIFFLKTKGKRRGYVERVEQTFPDENVEEVRVTIIKPNEDVIE